MTVALEPWVEAVVANGRNAIVSLLSGSARLGQLSAAEPEDAVAALIQRLDSDEPAIDAFDRGCLDALVEFRSSILSLEGPSFDVMLSRLVSLVNIIRRMKPERTVVDLHRSYVTWNAFFENFVIDRGLDLRREFCRILALTQEEAEKAGLAHRRLMPLWLSICGECGGSGRYDESYLRVALLGLRRLPLGQDFSSNEDFALQGLARWAAARNPSKAALLREWHVLEGDFPREADFWPPRVEKAIAAMEQEISERTHHKRETFPAAAWWREDVEVTSIPRHGGGASPEPPPRQMRENVLRQIGDSFSTIKGPVDRLVTAHRRYADATGDVFYLVRTACNVGMRLIENGAAAEHAIRGDAAVRLARLALDYDPTNVFAWVLIRDGLEAEGRLEDAELVGWETIRRFPEDPQWRNQLATLLSDSLGRPKEAAALLRESVALFPDHPTSRTQLATVLAVSLSQPEEAAAVLRESVALFPDNPHSRTQLATVLADDLNQSAEAEAVLEAARQAGAADDATASLLWKLHRGQKLRAARRSPVAAPLASEVGPFLELPTAAARRALFRFENGLADIDSVRGFLDQHTPDVYLSYVGERTGARSSPLKTAFAFAFEAAARDGSAAALQALMLRARPLEGVLIRQAIAAIETRAETMAVNDNEAGSAERVFQLVQQFNSRHPPAPAARLTLLRDTAASFLSTDVFRIAA